MSDVYVLLTEIMSMGSCCLQVLESQLANRRQRELDLERQVAELQLKAEQLGGAVSSAEAAASRRNQLEQQVTVQTTDRLLPG